MFNIHHFTVHNNNTIHIISRSTIIIRDEGGIKCTVTNIDENKNEEEPSNVGLIILISLEDIIINGCLQSNQICLFAKNRIVNYGEINAETLVCCQSFKFKNKHKNNLCPLMINNIYIPNLLDFNTDSKQTKHIKLSIYKHRGHFNDSTPPTHLLNYSATNYCSEQNSEDQKTSDDWIIFRIDKRPGSIHPKIIQIINSDDSFAIHRISVWMGSEDNDTKWYRLCQDIKYILPMRNEKQDFVIENDLLLSDYFIYAHKLNLIKIYILRNYGAEWNMFRSFALFGAEFG
eukprot:455555_1